MALPFSAFASQNPKPPLALRRLRQLLQLRLREFAVGNDRDEMIAHLADDVDGEEEFFARPDIIDPRRSLGGGVAVLQILERLAQELVVQKILRAPRLGGRLAEPDFIHRSYFPG